MGGERKIGNLELKVLGHPRPDGIGARRFHHGSIPVGAINGGWQGG
jgi:hypothetical protein